MLTAQKNLGVYINYININYMLSSTLTIIITSSIIVVPIIFLNIDTYI